MAQKGQGVMRIAVLVLALLFSLPAAAQDIPCTQDILEWQQICLAFDVLDETGCDISDICVLEETTVEDIIRDATVEIPTDTPKGFSEQIYIIP